MTGGVPPLEGTTILERRRFARDHLDAYRRLLVFEPRGHADMYGCHVVPPNDDGADLGVVFFHNEGYSTACGHGTIALVTWALDEGVIEQARGREAGRRRRAVGPARDVGERSEGRVRSVRFRNVPSFVWAREVEAAGRVVDVAYGGAFYAWLEERVEPAELPRLIELGRADQGGPRGGARGRPPARAGAARRLRGDLLAARGRRAADAAKRHRVRRRRGRPLTVRQRDLGAARAPARRGTARRRRELRHLSIVGSEFTGRVVGETDVARPAGGRHRRRGHRVTAPVAATFELDPDDLLGEGFLLR